MKHFDYVLWASFSPNGQWVVTASRDNTARVWDARTGRPLTEPLKHGKPVNFAQFSPDSTRVVTASDDGAARVWDAQTGQPLTDPLSHAAELFCAQFSPDGRRIVTACRDNSARVWDVDFAPSRCPDWLLPLAEALAGKRLSEEGLLEETTLDRAQTIAKIRQYLDSQPGNADGVLWGRWLLANPSKRNPSPFSTIPTPR
jgi:hypothetical protein